MFVWKQLIAGSFCFDVVVWDWLRHGSAKHLTEMNVELRSEEESFSEGLFKVCAY